MLDEKSTTYRDKVLYAIGTFSVIGFGLLWEVRWRHLSRELSNRQENASVWHERALHDPLTSLPNRTLLNDRMEQALIRAQRNETRVATLFVDLDNFKQVNDRHGHLVGDQLLIAVGDRLRQNLRASDTAARLGGDEFVVLIDIGEDDPENTATIVAERLRRSLQVPLLLEPEPITINASIGITVSEHGSEDPNELLHTADRALLAAKQRGKNQIAVVMPHVAADQQYAGH